jgi:hypothetical protein
MAVMGRREEGVGGGESGGTSRWTTSDLADFIKEEALHLYGRRVE